MSELSPTYDTTLNSDELYTDATAYRPPLPVDRAIIMDFEYMAELQKEPPLPGYAFGGLPTWIARTIGELYDRLGKRTPIITVDLCSSTPIYAQRLRANEFDRDGARGRELERDLYSDSSLKKILKKDSSVAEVFRAIKKDHDTRQLLSAALQETLYQITSEEANADLNGKRDLFRDRLIEKISSQSVFYDQELQTQGDKDADNETLLSLKFTTVDVGESYLDRVANVDVSDPLSRMSRLLLETEGSNDWGEDIRIVKDSKATAGHELARRFIRVQADLLTDAIVGNRRYKPARFLSLDSSKPEEIGISGILNNPPETVNTNMFTHAIASLRDGNQHMERSLFEPLPFPDDTIALITCFDGWPFHFQLDEDNPMQQDPQMQLFETRDRQPSWDADKAQRFEELAVKTLLGLYKKLAHGGKIVIFPWDIPGQNAEKKESLERIMDHVAEELNEPITEQRIMRKTLMSFMSDADLKVAFEQSSILKYDNRRFRPLIIEKPKLSSEKSRLDSGAKRAMKQSRARTQD